MIISVKAPMFLINTKNPCEVVYNLDTIPESKTANYRTIFVETFKHELPVPKLNEILYTYQDKKGYLLKIEKGSTIHKEYDPRLTPSEPPIKNNPDKNNCQL
jgi:hypothetical protein